MKQKNIDQLLDALRELGPMTTAQLQEKMGLRNSAVQKRIVSARELDLIHVSGHTVIRSEKPYSRQLWAIGSGMNAQSNAKAMREALLERKRIAEQLDRAKRECKPVRDPFIAQFFGAAP